MGVDYRNHPFTPELPPGRLIERTSGSGGGGGAAGASAGAGEEAEAVVAREEWVGAGGRVAEAGIDSSFASRMLRVVKVRCILSSTCEGRILRLNRPGGNLGANGWFPQSTPIQMPPESGGFFG